MVSAELLRTLSRQDLEQLYLGPGPVAAPRGRFVGQVLCWLDSRAARSWGWRLATRLLFERSAFGIDFERRQWFFWHPALSMGRFAARVAPSRWRQTQTVVLEYHGSALPGLVRRHLYDEVKPLSDTVCLGIGGVNAPRGEGELFFFLLEAGQP